MDVTKSQFLADAEAFLRRVEQSGRAIIVTDHGRPVIRVGPYRQDAKKLIEPFRGSVLRYDDPTEPVGLEDWELLP